jgi:hypothetical protein
MRRTRAANCKQFERRLQMSTQEDHQRTDEVEPG